MSKYQGVPLKYFNLLGASELRSSRITVAFIAVTVVLSLAVGFLINMNAEMQTTNRTLQSERVMYGFPNAEGVFVSERQIPPRHITAFAAVFVDNYFNFTPESAETNGEEAMRMMSTRLRAIQEDGVRNTATQSAKQQITQVFAKASPYQIKQEGDLGYVVSFQARRNRITLGTVFDRKMYNVKLLIKPVKPSKHFEWAVVVDDYRLEEIAQ